MKQEIARKNALIALVTLSVFVMFLTAKAAIVNEFSVPLSSGGQVINNSPSLLSALSTSVAHCLKGQPLAGNEHGDAKLGGPLAGNEHGDAKLGGPLAGNEHGDKLSGPLAGNEHGDKLSGPLAGNEHGDKLSGPLAGNEHGDQRSGSLG